MNGTGNYREDEQLLLRRFREIDPADPRSIIAYFDENAAKIACLPEEDQRHIHRSFLSSLYQLGDHIRYTTCCTEYIGRLFDTYHSGDNWKEELSECLFRKASSCFHIGDLESARRTLDELMKLDPAYPGTGKLYIKVLIHQQIDLLQGISAVTILTSLLAATVIAVELFYIRPFASDLAIMAEYLRVGLFSFSIVHFFVAHSYLRWLKYNEAGQRLREAARMHREKQWLAEIAD